MQSFLFCIHIYKLEGTEGPTSEDILNLSPLAAVLPSTLIPVLGLCAAMIGIIFYILRWVLSECMSQLQAILQGGLLGLKSTSPVFLNNDIGTIYL